MAGGLGAAQGSSAMIPNSGAYRQTAAPRGSPEHSLQMQMSLSPRAHVPAEGQAPNRLQALRTSCHSLNNALAVPSVQLMCSSGLG